MYSAAMLSAPALVLPPFMFFKRGRERMSERLGFWNLDFDRSIWVHGASLGEMIGLANIAREIKTALGDIPVVASATSPSGLPKAAQFAEAVRLLPFDSPLYYRRVLERLNARAFIFGETELWPNLLQSLSEKGVPTFLVNARLSDGAFRNYSTFKGVVKPAVSALTHVFAATEEAREKLTSLGVESDRISVVANTKYDIEQKELLEPDQKRILSRTLFAEDHPIVCLSSLRPGEEDDLFAAIAMLEKDGQKRNYLIAPRHSEKFDFFDARLRTFSLPFERRSKTKSATQTRFLLLDTIGELTSVMPAADLVFVGGTFRDFGGHNPLEAAALRIAPVIGPYRSNIRDVSELLESSHALFSPKSVHEIAAVLRTMGNEDHHRVSSNAKKVADSLKGSSAWIVGRIIPYIKQ